VIFKEMVGGRERVTTRVFKSGYPLSGCPDLSANFTAAKNPDILK